MKSKRLKKSKRSKRRAAKERRLVERLTAVLLDEPDYDAQNRPLLRLNWALTFSTSGGNDEEQTEP